MKKTFKSVIVSFLCLVIMFSGCVLFGGCSSREEVLRIYVPGEYIDDPILHGSIEDEIQGFENWYKELTGKNITVVKKEFDTNETMYAMVAVKRQDFDIICPSDYMVERMISENLLVKVNPEIMKEIKGNILGAKRYEEGEVEDDLVGELVLDEFDNYTFEDENNNNKAFVELVENSFDPNFEYACPYMWGTMGIMYYYTGEDLNNKDEIKRQDNLKKSWQSLFKVSERKIYMKDSERDSYTVALFNHYYDKLREASNEFTNFETPEYKELLNNIFVAGDDFNEKIEYAKSALTNQKKYVYDYESDEGKDDLLTSKGAQGYYGAFWSCDAGYIMADFSGEEVVYNENFRYIVPEEGSNVWVDSFCISKYAGNKRAAELFMLYMTDPEVAFNCMDYAGCTSSVYQATVDYYDYLVPNYEKYPDLTEDDYDIIFNECSEGFKSNYLSLMFPNKDIKIGDYEIKSPLNRCAIMRDFGARANDDLLKMWTNLRRVTL